MSTGTEEIDQRIYAHNEREIGREKPNGEAHGDHQSSYNKRMDGGHVGPIRRDQHKGRRHGNA